MFILHLQNIQVAAKGFHENFLADVNFLLDAVGFHLLYFLLFLVFIFFFYSFFQAGKIGEFTQFFPFGNGSGCFLRNGILRFFECWWSRRLFRLRSWGWGGSYGFFFSGSTPSATRIAWRKCASLTSNNSTSKRG